MKKRALATVLWFLTAWMFGAMTATIFGLSMALAPILGVATAAIVARDPRHLIWKLPSKTERFEAAPQRA